MALICPDCRGSLEMQSVVWAMCVQHGGRYRVLFDRHASVRTGMSGFIAPPKVAADHPCASHATQPAVARCGECERALCGLCSYEVAGKIYCADCCMRAAKRPVVPAPQSCATCGLSFVNDRQACHCGQSASMPDMSLVAGQPRADLGSCVNHPEVSAAVNCSGCGSALCEVCDFPVGHLHACPSCIENDSGQEIDPKRKRLTYFAIALGVWSTVLFLMLVAGVFDEALSDPDNGKAADLIITNIILWPLLIATALSLSAIEKRLKNTMLMKGVAWWNGILSLIFVLILIAANLGLIGG